MKTDLAERKFAFTLLTNSIDLAISNQLRQTFDILSSCPTDSVQAIKEVFSPRFSTKITRKAQFIHRLAQAFDSRESSVFNSPVKHTKDQSSIQYQEFTYLSPKKEGCDMLSSAMFLLSSLTTIFQQKTNIVLQELKEHSRKSKFRLFFISNLIRTLDLIFKKRLENFHKIVIFSQIKPLANLQDIIDLASLRAMSKSFIILKRCKTKVIQKQIDSKFSKQELGFYPQVSGAKIFASFKLIRSFKKFQVKLKQSFFSNITQYTRNSPLRISSMNSIALSSEQTTKENLRVFRNQRDNDNALRNISSIVERKRYKQLLISFTRISLIDSWNFNKENRNIPDRSVSPKPVLYGTCKELKISKQLDQPLKRGNSKQKTESVIPNDIKISPEEITLKSPRNNFQKAVYAQSNLKYLKSGNPSVFCKSNGFSRQKINTEFSMNNELPPWINLSKNGIKETNTTDHENSLSLKNMNSLTVRSKNENNSGQKISRQKSQIIVSSQLISSLKKN